MQWQTLPHFFWIKVRQRAMIRNCYNQAPHLTQGTNPKVTNSQLDITNESQEVKKNQNNVRKC